MPSELHPKSLLVTGLCNPFDSSFPVLTRFICAAKVGEMSIDSRKTTSAKTTLGNVLESDVISNVVQFLGMKEAARGFCLLNKLALKKYFAAYTTTKPNAVPTAKLIEKRRSEGVHHSGHYSVRSGGLAPR